MYPAYGQLLLRDLERIVRALTPLRGLDVFSVKHWRQPCRARRRWHRPVVLSLEEIEGLEPIHNNKVKQVKRQFLQGGEGGIVLGEMIDEGGYPAHGARIWKNKFSTVTGRAPDYVAVPPPTRNHCGNTFPLPLSRPTARASKMHQ